MYSVYDSYVTSLGFKHRTPVVTNALPMTLNALYRSIADALYKLDPK